MTVAGLCNQFLAHKEQLRDNGELNPRTWRGYYDACARVADVFGKSRAVVDLRPDDFRKLRAKLAEGHGLVWVRNEMQRIRGIFKFAFDEGLILAPVRFGQGFTRPKQEGVDKAREEHRQKHGPRMFEAEEIRRILAACGQPLRAMVLLAANGGLGQTDLARLPLRALDLKSGWLDYARAKTGVPRRIPIWQETAAAIREWLPQRPKAKDPADAGLLFLTVRGAPWVKVSAKGAPKDAIGQEFGKALDALGLKRSRRAFYSLRHTFETVGGETTDQVAVDVLMGHKIKGMAANYVERIGDDRLLRVTEHVRAWLFAEGPEPSGYEICDPYGPCDPALVGKQETGSQGVEGSQNSEPDVTGQALRLYVG